MGYENKVNKTFYGGDITTSYEKVLKILKKVQICLKTYDESNLADELNYVIQKIQSNSLYSYNIEKELNDMEKDFELKSIYDSLYEYSENRRGQPLVNNLGNSGYLNPNGITQQVSKKTVRDTQVRFKTLQVKKKLEVNDLFTSNNNLIRIEDETTRHEDDRKEELNNANHACEKNEQGTLDFTFKSATNNLINFRSASDQKQKDPFPYGLKASYTDSSLMDIISTEGFNIHEFYAKYGQDSFNLLPLCMLDSLNLLALMNQDKFNLFISQIRQEYNSVPYHNEKHGADVCHSLFTYINKSDGFESKLKISKMDTLTLLVAGLCHDVGHPGYNNNFHINSLSSFAVTYNDKSVLENFHASQSTKILLNSSTNFLEDLGKSEFRRFRKFFIEAILATDMTFHAKLNSIIKIRLNNLGIIDGVNIEKLIPDNDEMIEAQQDVFNFLLHTADISHNAKLFKISFVWVSALCEEFWSQGDTEKTLDLPISYLCDRVGADVPKSQVGFLTYIITPTFTILSDMFPNLSYLSENVESNIEKWKNYSLEHEKTSEHDYKEASMNGRSTSLVASVSSTSVKPKLIFRTHFTSINVDEESICD